MYCIFAVLIYRLYKSGTLSSTVPLQQYTCFDTNPLYEILDYNLSRLNYLPNEVGAIITPSDLHCTLFYEYMPIFCWYLDLRLDRIEESNHYIHLSMLSPTLPQQCLVQFWTCRAIFLFLQKISLPVPYLVYNDKFE